MPVSAEAALGIKMGTVATAAATASRLRKRAVMKNLSSGRT